MSRLLPTMRAGCLLVLLLAGAGSVQAHGGEPLNTIRARVGPYPVVIEYYSAPRGGEPLLFAIRPETPPTGALRYQVTAVPVTAGLEPDPDDPTGIHGRVILPVSGQWLLSITIDGPLGAASREAPIVAGAPPAIPTWLGWLIGLIPTGAMLSFLATQALRAERRPMIAA